MNMRSKRIFFLILRVLFVAVMVSLATFAVFTFLLDNFRHVEYINEKAVKEKAVNEKDGEEKAGEEKAGKEKAGEEKAGKHISAEHQKYYCPMHPSYVSDRPGKCPICGMDLVPVEQDMTEQEAKESELRGEEKERGKLSAEAIKISPYRQQLIGVRYTKVRVTDLEKEIRGVGYIDYDERLVKSISLRFSGWIEKLWANWEGKFVRKGEPLLTVFSPELASSKWDYLIALKSMKELQSQAQDRSPQDRASHDRELLSRDAEKLLSSAKFKLKLFGLTDEQIRSIDETDYDPYITILSPFTGFIIKKNVFEGEFVEPQKELFKIADTSRLWMLIEIYEDDIPFVKVGQRVKIIVSYLPGKDFIGKVSYIYPYLDRTLRTLKVRVEVQNPKYELKPGMYATALINLNLGKNLVVDDDAVVFSGDRAYVFLKGAKPDVIIPKEVKLGGKTNQGYIVLEGLNEGDEVVASANFLIDSESKLKSALRAFMGENGEDGANEYMHGENMRGGMQYQSEHPEHHHHEH